MDGECVEVCPTDVVSLIVSTPTDAVQAPTKFAGPHKHVRSPAD
jgi:hypothetical protein